MQTDDQEKKDASSGMVIPMHEKTFQAEVTEEYVAEDDSQLTIKVGQIVTIYGEGEDQNGWYYGFYKDGTSQSQGYLPSTYVTPLKGPEDSIAKHDPLSQYGPSSAFGSGDSQPYKIENDSIEQPMIRKSDPRVDDDLVPAPDVDPTTVLNTYTKYIEWLAGIILFLSGCLCVAYGTATSKALGSIQLIFSAFMLTYLLLKREAYYNSPAILRAGIWFIASIFAWTAPPAGLLGAIAATIAMICNVHSHLNDSGPTEAPLFWEKLIEEFSNYGLMNYALMLVWAILNICVWFAGKSHGATQNKNIFGGEVKQMEGIEGCGFLISFNLMCMMFISCKHILGILRIQLPIPFDWLCENYLGIHYALFATITIATIGHIFAVFDAYDNQASFVGYFGGAPLGTGVVVFGVMIKLWALMISPYLFWRGPVPRIFVTAHNYGYPLLLLLLFFHGKGGWGSNYWKWMISPLVLYLIDNVMRRFSSD